MGISPRESTTPDDRFIALRCSARQHQRDTFQGWIADGELVNGAAISGLASFDGKGQLTGTEVQNVGGELVTQRRWRLGLRESSIEPGLGVAPFVFHRRRGYAEHFSGFLDC